MIYNPDDEAAGLIDYRMIPPQIVSPEEAPDVKRIKRNIETIRNKSKKELNFFTPSFVSIQLGSAQQALVECSKYFSAIKAKFQTHEDVKITHVDLVNDSQLLYNYIQSVQVAIIFSFSALETFINISIPDEYLYKRENKKSTEIFNKEQIERHIPWKEKLKHIVTNIYRINDIDRQPFWNHVNELIQVRNELVHIKSKDEAQLIEKLVNMNTVDLCFSANEFIEFVYKKATSLESPTECFEKFPMICEDISDGVMVHKIVPEGGISRV